LDRTAILAIEIVLHPHLTGPVIYPLLWSYIYRSAKKWIIGQVTRTDAQLRQIDSSRSLQLLRRFPMAVRQLTDPSDVWNIAALYYY
jgi:hypothetical protein